MEVPPRANGADVDDGLQEKGDNKAYKVKGEILLRGSSIGARK
jgi:hypothetical protein